MTAAHAGDIATDTYHIDVRGRLPARVLDELSDFTIDVSAETTRLTGPLADTAALYGVIARLEALGLTLMSIHPAHDLDQHTERR